MYISGPDLSPWALSIHIQHHWSAPFNVSRTSHTEHALGGIILFPTPPYLFSFIRIQKMVPSSTQLPKPVTEASSLLHFLLSYHYRVIKMIFLNSWIRLNFIPTRTSKHPIEQPLNFLSRSLKPIVLSLILILVNDSSVRRSKARDSPLLSIRAFGNHTSWICL